MSPKCGLRWNIGILNSSPFLDGAVSLSLSLSHTQTTAPTQEMWAWISFLTFAAEQEIAPPAIRSQCKSDQSGTQSFISSIHSSVFAPVSRKSVRKRAVWSRVCQLRFQIDPNSDIQRIHSAELNSNNQQNWRSFVIRGITKQSNFWIPRIEFHVKRDPRVESALFQSWCSIQFLTFGISDRWFMDGEGIGHNSVKEASLCNHEIPKKHNFLCGSGEFHRNIRNGEWLSMSERDSRVNWNRNLKQICSTADHHLRDHCLAGQKYPPLSDTVTSEMNVWSARIARPIARSIRTMSADFQNVSPVTFNFQVFIMFIPTYWIV
jgi:hypothetical protein